MYLGKKCQQVFERIFIKNICVFPYKTSSPNAKFILLGNSHIEDLPILTFPEKAGSSLSQVWNITFTHTATCVLCFLYSKLKLTVFFLDSKQAMLSCSPRPLCTEFYCEWYVWPYFQLINQVSSSAPYFSQNCGNSQGSGSCNNNVSVNETNSMKLICSQSL